MASEEVHLSVREAVPEDAERLIQFLNQLDEGFSNVAFVDQADLTVEEEQIQLDRLYHSKNNALILAMDLDKVIGLISVSGSKNRMTEHIGEIGIVVDNDYQNLGIGTILMEEAMLWAEESNTVKRLELQVQKRNTPAVKLYEKMGFSHEAMIKRGAKAGEEFLDVFQMSYLI